MKRILVLCTLLLCLALTAVLFASCDLTPDPAGDETTAPAHEHVWDEGTFTPGRCDPTTKETIENGKIVYEWNEDLNLEERAAVKLAIDVKQAKKPPQIVKLPVSLSVVKGDK